MIVAYSMSGIAPDPYNPKIVQEALCLPLCYNTLQQFVCHMNHFNFVSYCKSLHMLGNYVEHSININDYETAIPSFYPM